MRPIDAPVDLEALAEVFGEDIAVIVIDEEAAEDEAMEDERRVQTDPETPQE